MGPGSRYRLTVLGPGVTPAVSWEHVAGRLRPERSRKVETERQIEEIKRTLDLSSAECHS
jgi:hypothetical protein